jgi:hypothetical protein
MRISYKLIMLGLAFGLLGSAGASAKPMPHFHNLYLWHGRSTVARHVPTPRTDGTTGYARDPDKDGWPANMILD